MKNIFILFCIISMSATDIYSQGILELLREGRSLEASANEEEALKVFLSVLERSPNNHEALWNVSFLYSRIGHRKENHEVKVRYFNKAKDYAEQALRINPRNEQSNYVMAVAMGRMALISGARDRVAASRDIKKYAEQTLEANTEHAGGHHVMGLWHYRMANLSWSERNAARILFGGIPEGASDEDAIYHLNKAVDLEPGFLLYQYDLADVYIKLENKNQAKEILKNLLNLPNKTADDPKIKKDAQELLNSL
ncbi:MAG: hypothetical protein EA412_07620 [Chitinophagaceae bacterium]|nr:MAG: hypothetical protein EA412_07620 [Chitinophagaceae bacterium]